MEIQAQGCGCNQANDGCGLIKKKFMILRCQMYIKGGETRLYDNLFRQLSAYWGESDKNIIQECVPETLKRVEKILKFIYQRQINMFGRTIK